MSSLYGISVKEKGDLHMYFLPGQVLSDGSPINISFRIQCNRGERDSKPEWAVWKINPSEVKIHPGGKHYVKPGTLDYIATLSFSTSNYQTLGDENVVFYKQPATGELYITKDKILADFSSEKRPREITDADKKAAILSTIANGLLEGIGTRDEVNNIFGYDINEYVSELIISKGLGETISTATSSETVKEEKKEEPVAWIEEIIKKENIIKPTASKDGFFVSNGNWKLLIRNIKRHVNTLITGPAGTGKTSIVRHAADKLGLPLHIFDMGAMIDPISSLLGVHRLKDGQSIFDYASFTRAIQEPGIILLDEVNRASMGVGNILFPCLDERRYLPIEIANGDGERNIPIHPEVCFIATANIGANYTGTSVLDTALVSRFFPLELSYLTEDIEREVLETRTGIEKSQSELIVKMANTIRNMNSKMELSISVSIRETLMISSLVKDGWRLGDAMKTVFLPLFEGTNNEGERSKLYKALASF